MSAQPHTLILYNTFCNSHSIHRRRFRQKVSIKVVNVYLMYGSVRKSFQRTFLVADEWIDFSPFWCTKHGRVKLTQEQVPKSKECKELCIKLNPKCKAVEWWTKAGGLCFECNKPSLKRPYRDPSDLAHPPHVFIKQQSRGKMKIKKFDC